MTLDPATTHKDLGACEEDGERAGHFKHARRQHEAEIETVWQHESDEATSCHAMYPSAHSGHGPLSRTNEERHWTLMYAQGQERRPALLAAQGTSDGTPTGFKTVRHTEPRSKKT